MDELVHHCLRELSFDGDCGCDVSRLRDFINGFYTQNASSLKQTVDDTFCAFVWSLVVQQPSVKVGTVPLGSAEVYVAPQASAKRLLKAKEEPSEAHSEPEGLDAILDAALRPLEDLRIQYNDGLRIAVDRKTCFEALTGSHIRLSKLTPIVYTALQLIARGRENGITVVELGKKTGYDQKTCFYVVKQLLDLNLIEKRRRPGISSNICIHKYFFDNSPVWQKIVAEEAKVESDAEEDDAADLDEGPSASAVSFTPIDSRCLSSFPLIRARLVKLLKNSPHHIHAYHDLLRKIGFKEPVKSDRRFFRIHLRDLTEQGIVEKVQVPHPNRARFPDKKVICLRLLDEGAVSEAQEDASIAAAENIDIESAHTELKINLTIHKQIITVLDQAGTRGMTLSELSSALCDFDRRTIELLLTRLEKDPPPPHLIDLGIAQLGETHGREKRYKYYTIAHYKTIAERERFDDPHYLDKDFSQVGDFLPVVEKLFYEDHDSWARYVDNFKTGTLSTSTCSSAKKPLGRPRKHQIELGKTPKAKSGYGKKRKKTDVEEEDAAQVGDAEPVEPGEPPPKKKRGRPRKTPTATDLLVSPPSVAANGAALEVPQYGNNPTKKRGRPSKKRPPQEGEGDASSTPAVNIEPSTDAPSTSVAPRKRGRPPKVKQSDAIAEEDTSVVVKPTTRRRGRLSKSAPASGIVLTEGDVVQDTLDDGVMASQGPADAHYAIDAGITDTYRHLRTQGSTQACSPQLQTDGLRAIETIPLVPSASGDIARDFSDPQHDLVEDITRNQDTAIPERAEAAENSYEQSTVSASDVQQHANTSQTSAGHATRPEATEVSSAVAEPVFIDGIPIDPMLLDTTARNDMEPASLAPEISAKRGQSETSISSGPPLKRARTKDAQAGSGFRTKANISQSRRENEILQVIQDAGGIMNTSVKEFCEAHAAIVEAITKAGGEASTKPGALLDKRTVEHLLDALQSRGKVKLLTTLVRVSAGTRPTRIVYLPEVSDEQLHVFLENLTAPMPGFAPAVKVLDEHVNLCGSTKKTRQQRRDQESPVRANPAIDPAILRDSQQFQHIFNHDDASIRAALLTDKTTLAQHYGYISGKALRARQLHLASIELFHSPRLSRFVVSSEHRVLHFDHYFEDMPVALYCSLMMTLVEDEGLTELLRSPEGRLTPVAILPGIVQQKLELGRSRSKFRILDLLELLRGLGIAQPLQPCGVNDAVVTLGDNGQGQTFFKPCDEDSWKTLEAPQIWQFLSSAPLYAWSLSDTSPPYWKYMPMSTLEECSQYWDELHRIGMDRRYAESLGLPFSTEPLPNTAPILAVKRCICRNASWRVHTLSDAQTEYLSRHLDKTSGTTPLQDADGGTARINQIAWVTSAPPELVHDFYERAYTKHANELRKAQRRHQQAAEAQGRNEQAKATIAKRAADAKQQKEKEWDEMVRTVHPEPLKGTALARLNRTHTQFLQTTRTDRLKWEAAISEAIREAVIAAEKLLPVARHSLVTSISRAPIASPPQVVAGAPEKSIEELVKMQDALPVRHEKKKKRKGDEEPEEPSRRHRFQWTKEFDELARDAVAIIKARCRGATRLDLGALIQVFPRVPRNSVRQREIHIRADSPAQKTYQERLEDRWHQLWMQHRGTDILPDNDPASPTNFDLIAHLNFLRKHVDKNALRVGYVEQNDADKVILTSTSEEVESAWDVVEKKAHGPGMDFMWTVTAEETREKLFTQQAFVTEEDAPLVVAYSTESVHIADCALKMVFGAPSENYDPDAGARLLHQLGEENVTIAREKLLKRGVLSKLVRDPVKNKPGRTLKISDSNENALGGSIPQETFQDAAALEDLLYHEDPGEWREWPLLATDGDTAALLELVSEGKIEFTVDTAHAQAARSKLDWNSKKADDDDIETSLQIRLIDYPVDASPPPAQMEVLAEPSVSQLRDNSVAENASHGQTEDGSAVCCKLSSSGVVNCQTCLEDAVSRLMQSLLAYEESAAMELLNTLRLHGSQGVPKTALVGKMQSHDVQVVSEVVRRVTGGPVPLAYWAGYKSVVLVSAAYVGAWTVATQNPEGATTRLFPRRWLDIAGRRMIDVWEAALRAVIGVILPRPGIPQAEIRWRLRSVYDRQEVDDVLEYLLDDGLLQRRILANPALPVGRPDDAQERVTTWFVLEGGEKRWYQV